MLLWLITGGDIAAAPSLGLLWRFGSASLVWSGSASKRRLFLLPYAPQRLARSSQVRWRDLESGMAGQCPHQGPHKATWDCLDPHLKISSLSLPTLLHFRDLMEQWKAIRQRVYFNWELNFSYPAEWEGCDKPAVFIVSHPVPPSSLDQSGHP